MRPQQQNRRLRGRSNSNSNSNNNNNNSNRKGPNPLTRNYESNGPDVKIRGSAHQIAEKYATLARDAQSAGDRVMAENYLQHAEHYNRIIATAQAQMPTQNMRDNRNDGDEDEDERDDIDAGTAGEMPRPAAGDGSGPQPVIEGVPAEVAYQDQQASPDQGQRVNGNHVNGAKGEETAQQRRGRRPRRSDRNRDEPEAVADAQAKDEAEEASAFEGTSQG